jgi:hypothetical protein
MTAQLEDVDPYPDVGNASTLSVLSPRLASSNAVAQPITPAPIMITS